MFGETNLLKGKIQRQDRTVTMEHFASQLKVIICTLLSASTFGTSLGVSNDRNTGCGSAGRLSPFAFLSVVLYKTTHYLNRDSIKLPACVGTFLPGKYDNYTDTVLIPLSCVTRESDSYVLRYGADDIWNGPFSEQRVYIVKDVRDIHHLHLHEHNVAVLKLKSSLHLDYNVQTTCLPMGESEGKPPISAECFLLTIADDSYTDAVPVSIASDSKCSHDSISHLAFGQEVPFKRSKHMCIEISEHEHYSMAVPGPIVCKNRARWFTYGTIIPTLSAYKSDIFRATKLSGYSRFLESVRTKTIDELIKLYAENNEGNRYAPLD